MNILVGGRLSKEIKEELEDIVGKDTLLYSNIDRLKNILLSKGVKPFKKVDNIFLFDTGILSFTDWNSLNIILDYLDTKIYLISRFTTTLPSNIRNNKNVIVYGYDDYSYLDIDDIYVRLSKDLGIEERDISDIFA